MAKGQMRSNKEKRKPKKDDKAPAKSATPAPFANVGKTTGADAKKK